jgi:hypothetical protein
MKKSAVYLVYSIVVLTSLFTNVAAEDCSLLDILCVDDTPGSTQEYSTISAALDAASAGDTVAIYNGIYRESYRIRTSLKNWDGLTIKAADGQTQVYWQNDKAEYAKTGGSLWTNSCTGCSSTIYRSASPFTDYMTGIFYEAGGQVYRVKPEDSLAELDFDDQFWYDQNQGGTGSRYVYIRLADRGSGRDPDNYVIHLQDGAGVTEIADFFIKLDHTTRGIDGMTIDGINFRYMGLGGPQYTVAGFASKEFPGSSDDLTNLIIQNCTFRYFGQIAITMDGVSGDLTGTYNGPDLIYIKNCTFDNVGGYNWHDSNVEPVGKPKGGVGGGFGLQRMIVQDSTFSSFGRGAFGNLGADYGVITPNKGLTVERCVINGGDNFFYNLNDGMDDKTWDTGDVWPGGIRIKGWAGDHLIRDNIFIGLSGTPIYMGGTDSTAGDIEIYHNTFAYNCKDRRDVWCSPVLVYTTDYTDLVIKNNIFWGNNRGNTYKGNPEGIFFAGGASTLPSDGSKIDHNLYADDTTYSGVVRIQDEGGDGPTYSFSEWQNYTNSGAWSNKPDANSLAYTYAAVNNYPKFVDNKIDGTGDYRIQSTSPAIDKGLAGLTTYDIDGQLRDASADIGADEYLSETTPSCSEGAITQTCTCGGTEYSSGYCCSGSWQNSPCLPTVTVFSPIPYLGDALNWEPLNSSRWDVINDGDDYRYGIITTNYENLPGSRLGEYSLIKDRTYTDFLFNSTVRSTDDFVSNPSADYDIVFGYQDPNNYYYMMFNRYGPNSDLFRIVNGQRVLIAETNDFSIPDNNYHDVETRRLGEDIKVLFNGSLILDFVMG